MSWGIDNRGRGSLGRRADILVIVLIVIIVYTIVLWAATSVHFSSLFLLFKE